MSDGATAAPHQREIFVSYADRDLSWAEWIGWELEEGGLSVLLQQWDVVAGRNWVAAFDEGIRNVRHIIAVVTPAYRDSVVAAPAWQAAWQEDPTGAAGKLIPVHVDHVGDGTGLLGLMRPIVLAGLAEKDARSALLDGIAAVRVGRAKPGDRPPLPASDRAVERRPRFPGLVIPIPLEVLTDPDRPQEGGGTDGARAGGGPPAGDGAARAATARPASPVRPEFACRALSPTRRARTGLVWMGAATACGVVVAGTAVGVVALSQPDGVHPVLAVTPSAGAPPAPGQTPPPPAQPGAGGPQYRWPVQPPPPPLTSGTGSVPPRGTSPTTTPPTTMTPPPTTAPPAPVRLTSVSVDASEHDVEDCAGDHAVTFTGTIEVAGGKGTLLYRWERDGSSITQGGTLQVTGAATQHAPPLRLRLTADDGSSTTSVRLVVHTPDGTEHKEDDDQVVVRCTHTGSYTGSYPGSGTYPNDGGSQSG